MFFEEYLYFKKKTLKKGQLNYKNTVTILLVLIFKSQNYINLKNFLRNLIMMQSHLKWCTTIA